MKSTAVFRADADSIIGGGHLARTLSLASEWTVQGGEAVLLSNTAPEVLSQATAGSRIEVWPIGTRHPDPGDLEALAAVIARRCPAWVVVDGYHFEDGYNAAARSAGAHVLEFSDGVTRPAYSANILLDQNLSTEERRYPLGRGATALLGTRYACLAQGFAKYRSRQVSVPPVAGRVLVTLGGADPGNQTSKVVQALMRVNGAARVTVVVGALNRHLEEIKRLAGQDARFTVVHATRDMPALMAESDMAVTAAGSTVWELAFMGVPAIMMALADNQRGIAQAAGERGVAINLGWSETVTAGRVAEAVGDLLQDAERRAELVRAGRAAVDGHGARRVVETMLQFAR